LERVAIRVKPGSARNRVGGSYPGPRGAALVVAVTAPPVDGRATEAALTAQAAALGVRRSAVTLVSGPAARDKVVAVDPAPAGLAARVAALRDGTGA
jgi:uncharacterized protein YggU (UPF0235/DUF167 family)